MTYTVSRAALLASGVSNIEFQVTQYAKNLKQWIDHHRKVEAEKSTPLRPEPQRVDFKSDEEFSEAFNHWTEEKINRHQPYPADVIHPDLMKCVRVGDGDEVTEDYTITEDLPTPEDVLRQKKNLLMSKVYDAEAKQVAALVLPGKQRLNQLRRQRLLAADHAKVRELQEETSKALSSPPQRAAFPTEAAHNEALGAFQKKCATAQADFQAKIAHPEAWRTEDDNAFLREQAEIDAKLSAIQEKSAEVLSEIEDLTSDNIDNWKLPEA